MPNEYATSLFNHLAEQAKIAGRKLSTSEWLAAVSAHYERHHPKPAKSPAKARSVAIDAIWLAELEQDPTYAGIDIRRELGKAQAWASVNGVGVSRRRFVNWLNRAVESRPIQVNGQGASSFARKPEADPEPIGWRDWVAANATDPSWAEKSWNELDSAQKTYIRTQLKG